MLIQTMFEALLVLAVIVGILNEDKLVDFERNFIGKIKNKNGRFTK